MPFHVLQELNYESSVTNEIACLRMFSHPGIARLVSAFRWRDGAYLVLEYASRGDLHSHVKEHGSLSEASTRLVRGCMNARRKNTVFNHLMSGNSVLCTRVAPLAKQ